MDVACTNNIPEQVAAKHGTTSEDLMAIWTRTFDEHSSAKCQFAVPPKFVPENDVRDWYSLCSLLKEIWPEMYNVNREWLQKYIAAEEPQVQRRGLDLVRMHPRDESSYSDEDHK